MVNQTPSTYNLHQFIYDGLNFATVAAVTSAAVVAFQSPVKTILVTLTKQGAFIPNYSGGTLGLFRTMYAGTFSMVGSSSARTLYVTGTKKNRPIEEITPEIQEQEEKKQVNLSKAGYVMAAAFGDILVTQIPESLSQYKKQPGFLPDNFKWNTMNNLHHLMVGGFVPRYVSGLVNFTCLCVIEDKVAEKLPITNESARHLVAGGVSGVIAAGFSYPFALFKDYSLLQTTINEKGQLATQNPFKVLKDLGSSFAKAPKEGAKTFLNNAAKQLPVRTGLTGGIFATVAVVGKSLGDEPLKTVIPERFQPLVGKSSSSFFNHSPVTPNTEAAPTLHEVSKP